jgi:hypothetical protein
VGRGTFRRCPGLKTAVCSRPAFHELLRAPTPTWHTSDPQVAAWPSRLFSGDVPVVFYVVALIIGGTGVAMILSAVRDQRHSRRS